MAIGDPYLTVEEFKSTVDKVGATQDTAILRALNAASRQVDNYCGRQFNQAEEAAARYYTIRPGTAIYDYYGWLGLDIDDAVSLSELAVDNGQRLWETVLAADTYELAPVGADVLGMPFTSVVLIGNAAFPNIRQGVKVTAVWGWPSVPEPIKEATFLLANRMKSMWTAPFGVAGSGELGTLQMASSITPIIREILNPYRVLTI